jgi:hypothetical protein
MLTSRALRHCAHTDATHRDLLRSNFLTYLFLSLRPQSEPRLLSSFQWLAAYFGLALWAELVSSASAGERAPLVRARETTRPPGVMSFGSLGQTSAAANVQPQPKQVVPFKGRGNRLGNE